MYDWNHTTRAKEYFFVWNKLKQRVRMNNVVVNVATYGSKELKKSVTDWKNHYQYTCYTSAFYHIHFRF